MEEEKTNDRKKITPHWNDDKMEEYFDNVFRKERVEKDIDDAEEFTIDKIIDHCVKNRKAQRYAKMSKTVYHFSSYDTEADDGTW